MTDTDVDDNVQIEIFNRLKELGFNVTVITGAILRNDGTRENIKKLIYKRESSHDFFIEHLTELHEDLPEIVTEAEVKQLIERRIKNPLSYTDENALVAPKNLLLKIEFDLDPSQDLAFVFARSENNGDRRKRAWWTSKAKRVHASIAVGVGESFGEFIDGIVGRKK